MCGEKSELELEAIISSAPAAARKGKGKARVRSEVPGVAAGRRKVSAWTGVRVRLSGRWATEIRLPRTREKVWIGTFSSPRQAALAYDAAVFCLFGERPPKSRPINFPAAPRPEISENARVQLSIVEMKAISEKHARAVDALLPPLVEADTTAAAPEDLVVAPATTPVTVDNAPPADSTNEWDWDNDEVYQMICNAEVDACNAEVDAPTFMVSDEEYYAAERSA